jgi:hypothetical protein
MTPREGSPRQGPGPEEILLRMVQRAPDGKTYPLLRVQLRGQREAIEWALEEIRVLRAALAATPAEGEVSVPTEELAR